ncbi:MAG TPA: tyrosine-type recombinase/integrase, partial [Verrucomicrobiota bacterium]|nr:tyrosine-type recombinase/integrase [Verrucomicrobiota bacterium]
MPLELRKQRDGRHRDSWYARYEIGGRRYVICLGVKVQGNAPASLSLKEKGDMDFECSRVAAQAKLDQIVEEARSKRGAAHLVERVYEMKTGEKVKSVKLEEVQEEWARLPRKREPSKYYVRQSRAILGRFVEFVRARNPKCQELSEVTRSLGRAFMDAEAERGIAAKTWNAEVMLLRSACRELLPDGGLNPFLGATSKAGETVFRKPFTPEEMKAILDTVKDDDFIRPIIVTGMCTALRRGDCCLLKWKDVDLERRFITVKTAKTGQTVGIPIFPLLYEELAALASAAGRRLGAGEVKARDGVQGTEGQGQRLDGYVFPKQAAMYRENSDGITWRVKKALAVAL